MKTSEFLHHLQAHPEVELRFQLPDGDYIPVHAHITEVGRVDKSFIDCGGTVRSLSLCQLQAWVAEDDQEHRLPPGKLAKVLEKAAPLLRGDDLEVEVEYDDFAITQYPVDGVEVGEDHVTFLLAQKHTDCLAKDFCFPEKAGGNCSDGENNCCC